jgi:hypothetical protein
MNCVFKNYAICLIAAITLSFAKAQGAVSESALRSYDINSVTISKIYCEGNEYNRILMPGMIESSKIGAPDLPCEIIQIQVPVGCRNFTVSAIPVGEIKTYALSARIYPSQPPVISSAKDLPPFQQPIGDYYNSKPGFYAEVLDDFFVDGNNHIVNIAVSPVLYRDNDLSIEVASELQVELSYQECTIAELNQFPIFPDSRNPRMRLKGFIANQSFNADSSHKGKYSLDVNSAPPAYYVIVPESLKESVKPLAVWKGQKGYNVTVKTVEDILGDDAFKIGKTFRFKSNMEQIVDEAAAVRAYLKSEYEKYGTYYCLLVGNSRTSMPIRRVRSKPEQFFPNDIYCKNPNGVFYIPADTYFSDFTSNWILTKDTTQDVKELIYSADNIIPYGPDIAIGRLLCSQGFEIDNYIKKLIIYESNPGKGDCDYLENFVYFEQDKWVKDNTGKEHNGPTLLTNSDRVRKVFDPFPETTIVIRDSCRFNDRSLPHDGSDIIKTIGKAGFSSWHGHGSPANIGCCDWKRFIIPMNSYTTEQTIKERWDWDMDCAIDLMNNKDKPSIAYSVSCTISPFDIFEDWMPRMENKQHVGYDIGHIYDLPYNFGEAFTVAGEYGGPALLANSRYGYVESSADLESYFGEYILQNPTVGIAEALSKTKASTAVRFTHHLIGEPEFEMWLNKPKRFANLGYDLAASIVSSPDLDGSVISVYDGTAALLSDSCRSSEYKVPAAYCNNDYCISVWKRGYIPSIQLFATKGSITNISKKYIVSSGSLGGGENYTYTIGNGARMDITCTGPFELKPGLIIESGGTLTIDCEARVSINGVTVRPGASLIIKSSSTQLGSGFNAELGSTVKINQM